jgi:hypothetical protein
VATKIVCSFIGLLVYRKVWTRAMRFAPGYFVITSLPILDFQALQHSPDSTDRKVASKRTCKHKGRPRCLKTKGHRRAIRLGYWLPHNLDTLGLAAPGGGTPARCGAIHEAWRRSTYRAFWKIPLSLSSIEMLRSHGSL